MKRCDICGAALPRGTIRCPRCGNVPGQQEPPAELDDDDLLEVEGSARDEPAGFDGPIRREAGWALDRNDSARLQLGDAAELELAAALPHEERAKKRSAEKHEVESEEERARKLADYGEPPQRAGEAAVYALWVVWRQVALRLALRDLEKRRRIDRSRLDAAHREAGESLYEQRGDAALTVCREELIAVAEIEQKIRLALEQDQRVKESVSQEMEYVVDTIFHTQKDTEPFRVEESRLLAELQKREQMKAAVEAEIRTAEEAYREQAKSTAGEPDPDWQQKVAEERRARQAKLEELALEMDGLNIDLEEVRTELRDTAKKVGELHHQRKAQLAERMKSAERREAERREAEKELHLAMQALGRRGYEEELELIPDAKRERICRAAEKLEGTEAEIALHRQAIASYDRGGVVKGVFFVAGLAALLTAVIVTLSLLFGSPATVGGEKKSPETTGESVAE